MLVVHVSDLGKGINRVNIDKLFTLFSSENSSDNEEGLGMGLNICKNIVEMNGGRIEVFSEGENLGSTFMALLTVSKESAPTEAINSELTPSIFHTGVCACILHVIGILRLHI